MIEGLLSFLGHLIAEVLGNVLSYQLGRWLLLALSLGRYDATKRKANEGLVGLFGVMFFLVSAVCLIGWLQGGWA